MRFEKCRSYAALYGVTVNVSLITLYVRSWLYFLPCSFIVSSSRWNQRNVCHFSQCSGSRFLKYMPKYLSFLFFWTKLRKANIGIVICVRPSVHPSFLMEQLGPKWADFHEVWYLSSFRKKNPLSRKFKLHSNFTSISLLHMKPETLFPTSRSFLIRTRNVSDKTCTENKKKILCSTIFSPENRAVYEIIWGEMW